MKYFDIQIKVSRGIRKRTVGRISKSELRRDLIRQFGEANILSITEIILKRFRVRLDVDVTLKADSKEEALEEVERSIQDALPRPVFTARQVQEVKHGR